MIISLSIKNNKTHKVLTNIYDVSYSTFKILDFSFVTYMSLFMPHISIENYMSVEICANTKLINNIKLYVDYTCVIDQKEIFTNSVKNNSELVDTYNSFAYKLSAGCNIISIPFT